MAEILVSGVSKAYALRGGGERLALGHIDLRVADGEFLCLLGPSGCGKTTLLNVLADLTEPDAGTVRLTRADGEPARYGYVFQEARLLPWMTVRENLRFVHGSALADAEIDYWLERVGLAGRGRDYPRQLSMGQRQRVAVARALSIRPDILFLDEPFSSLDELTAARLREELLELWADIECTIVFVTHNPLEATFLADRIVVMAADPGRIVADYRVEAPRPRDADDVRLWQASRQAVRLLQG